MEDLSVATVYYMIIGVNGRMLRHYVIVSLNFSYYIMLCFILRLASLRTIQFR
jgi:hypothetical protein